MYYLIAGAVGAVVGMIAGHFIWKIWYKLDEDYEADAREHEDEAKRGLL